MVTTQGAHLEPSPPAAAVCPPQPGSAGPRGRQQVCVTPTPAQAPCCFHPAPAPQPGFPLPTFHSAPPPHLHGAGPHARTGPLGGPPRLGGTHHAGPAVVAQGRSFPPPTGLVPSPACPLDVHQTVKSLKSKLKRNGLSVHMDLCPSVLGSPAPSVPKLEMTFPSRGGRLGQRTADHGA